MPKGGILVGLVQAMQNLSLKLYQFSLILIVVTIPFERHSNGVGLTLLIATWLWYFATNPKVVTNLLKNVPAMLLVLFLLLHVFSIIYSDDVVTGWKNIEKRLAFLIMPVVLTALVSIPKAFVSRLKWYYVNGVFAAVLITLVIAVLRTVVTGTLDYYNPESTLTENNFLYHRLSQGIGLLSVYFGFYISLAAAIVLSTVLKRAKEISRRKLLLHLLRLSFFGMYIILLKSAIMAIAFGATIAFLVLYFLFTTTYGKKIKLAAAFLLVVVAVVASAIVVNKVGASREIFEYDIRGVPPEHQWNSVNLRLAKWKVTADAISDHWLLGVGIGDSKQMLLDYYLKHNFQFAYLKQYNPHNQYLATFLTIGFPGIALLLVILTTSGLSALRMRDLAYFSFILLISCFALTEAALASNKAIVPFSFFLCYFSYAAVINKNKTE